ncbi:sulfurtransferase [Vibrio quintilis]|uniref:3-mercaptopyruvate sulfurtransferase n=1 Tax=Vibrio quintilis TaxID=1117707 RepID=A0A1M7Z393_9VIBR|nr:sulfurtransferase [Vibrio quintilis]SHO59361.1 3-mercaptopyruvate sulfurtransferase [Vibrio quintilis]
MSPIVSCSWLYQNRFDPRLVILDTSIEFQIPTAPEQDKTNIIAGARRFDYDNVFCDPDNPLPHMMPDEARFNQQARALGLNQDSLIVVYDNCGTYASPRAWWMLRAMGHQEVYILDGGLTGWKNQDMPLTQAYQTPEAPGDFAGRLQEKYFVSADYVLQQISDRASQTLDARSFERFSGQVPEPREGLRSGHIPGAANFPFVQVMDQHCFKSAEALKPIVSSALSDQVSEYIFSCGSGVTACIILLAAYICGYENLSVYDGSWTEWGQSQHPLETT